MCSIYKDDSDAYLFVPSGSGALIYPEIIVDKSLPKDFCEWIKAEKSGIKSVANLKITKNGITAITKLHTDVYKSVVGQKRVGANTLDKTYQVG